MRRPALVIEPLEDRVVPATYFFENTAGIAIPGAGTSGPASPYPSAITVAGLTGNITNVTVTLVNFNHTYPDDVEVLLGAPGANVELMRDAGGGVGGVDPDDAVNITYTFADGSPALLDSVLQPSGTYRPTQFSSALGYPAPAPAGPYATTLASLNGTSPNGTWNLFVNDDVGGDIGSFAGGWRLAITTDTGTTFPYRAATNPGVSAYALQVNGATLEVRNTGTNALLASQPVAGTTTATLTGEAGNDTVTIRSTPAGVATFYEGTNGADTITIGDAGSLAGIQGSVFLSSIGLVSQNDIVVDDSSGTTPRTYTSADGSLSITGVAAIGYASADTADLTVSAGSGADTFTISTVNGGNFTPVNTFNGGGGGDTFTLTASGVAVNATVVLNGGAGTDNFTVTGFPTTGSSVTVNGGGDAGDTLTVNDAAAGTAGVYGVANTQVTKTGALPVNHTGLDTLTLNTGTQGDTINVSRTTGPTTSVVAGPGGDAVVFAAGATLGGVVDGGADTDTINYAAYTTPVSANLGLGVSGLSAALGGGQVVPSNGSAATGTATGAYNVVSRQATVSILLNGVTSAITDLRLSLGQLGAAGSVVVPVGAGVFVPTGTPGQFSSNFVVTIPAASEAAFLGGGTYFELLTSAFPGGELRGQLLPTANQNLGNGTATGTLSVTGVENVTGGSAGDSLVGSFAANILSGLGGNDTLLGGPGSDLMVGGADDDTLIWSNGDGTDVMNGDAGTDTVSVNGSMTANDVFTIGANGTRIDFDRTSPGVFSLDIGTTERLRVNGGAAGGDSFTVNDLAGVADLFTLNLFGLAGDDTFDVTPAASVTIGALGGGGTDTLNLGSTAGPTDPFITPVADPAGGVMGSLTYTSLASIFFSQIEFQPEPFNFLTVTATDGLTTAAPGSPVTITVVVTNNSPLGLGSVGVSDLFPPELTGVTWTAAYTGSRSSGAAGGSGDIVQQVNLEAGGSVTYTVTATLRTDVVGSFTNTATATVPAELVEDNLADNTATDSTDITAALPTALVVTGPGGGSGLRFASSGGQFGSPQTVAFFPGFGGEVHIAQGDVDGDGVFDTVAATGPGAGVFKVLRGSDGGEAAQLEPFPGYAGGLFVAVGDLDGDGRADIAVTPDAIDAFSGPVADQLPVRVYSGNGFGLLAAFDGLASLSGASGQANPLVRLGGRPAIADANGDGLPDLIIAAGNGGGPRITVWSGTGFPGATGGQPTTNPIANLFVFESSQRGGAFVTAGDVNGDGFADVIVGGGPGGGPRVRIVNGRLLYDAGVVPNLEGVNLDDPVNLSNGLVLNNFFAGDLNRRGGLRVAVADVDADGRADLVTGSGTGEASSVRVYTGLALQTAFGTSSEPGVNQVLDPFGSLLPGGVFVG